MKEITEVHAGLTLYGGTDITGDERTNPLSPRTDFSQKNFKSVRPAGDRPEDLDGFQQLVYGRVVNGLNVFVNASPGAGKTRPIERALVVRYTRQAETTGKPLRVLVSVPLSQLAQQTHDTFINVFYKLLTNITFEGSTQADAWENAKLTAVINMIPAPIRPPINNAIQEFMTSNDAVALRRAIETTVVGVDTQGSQHRSTPHSLIDIAVLELAAGLITTKNYDIVIFDEIQQLFKPFEGRFDPALKKDMGYYDRMFKNCATKQVIFLTGSMNTDDITEFVNYLQSHYKIGNGPGSSGTKMDILPRRNDVRPTGNRSEIKVVPSFDIGDGSPRHAHKMIATAKEKIQSRIKYNVAILFSKPRIFDACQELIKTIPSQSTVTHPIPRIEDTDPVGGRGILNRRIIGKPVYHDARTFRQPFGKPNEFSDPNVGSRTLDPTYARGNPRRYQATRLVGREHSDQFHDLQQQHGIKIGTNIIVLNPLLADCIVRGFAFIVGGQKNNLRTEAERGLFLEYDDKLVIQSLFANGKIKFIFASDAVGIGINLNCQHLYIPSLQKFGAGKMGTIDESALIQLVHRAGRGKFGTAYVYTSPHEVERVTRIFNSEPSSVVNVVGMDRLKDVSGTGKLLYFFDKMINGSK